MTWQRLSVRDRQVRDDGPYEGVPDHLFEPLREWVDFNFGGAPNSYSDVHGGPRLASALRRTVFPQAGGRLTVRTVTTSVSPVRYPSVMLDIVDAVLHLQAMTPGQYEALDEILFLGGSVWQVDPSGGGLVRRVDETAAAAFAEAISPSDAAGTELSEAWVAAYGRHPDPSDAWDHSIKAVEAVLIPIVTPNKVKATLGDVVGILNSQAAQWKLGLHGHDDSQSVGPLVSMLRLMWPNPDRHVSGTSRTPSLAEAQQVVHLAVAITQWARCGALQKRT